MSAQILTQTRQAYLQYPDNPSLFVNYLQALRKCRAKSEAQQVLAMPFQAIPEHIPFLFGQLYLALFFSEHTTAQALVRRLYPTFPDTLKDIKALLQDLITLRQFNQAQPLFTYLCQHIAAFQTAPLFAQLAQLYAAQGDTESAKFWLQKSQHLAPDDPWYPLCQGTILPMIYQSEMEIDTWHQHYEASWDALLSQCDQALISALKAQQKYPNLHFLLAYQGRNNRALLEKIGQFWQRVYPPHQSVSRSPHSPLRIGFVSCYFNNHSVGQAFQHLIQHLHQHPHYQVYLFIPTDAADPKSPDKPQEALQNTCHEIVPLPWELETAAEKIKAQDLDLLLFPELGMDSMTYFLACLKLAHKQAVLTGHPITSGLSTVDYFVSSKTLEIPDLAQAQTHYSEKLVALNAMITDYPRPLLPTSFMSKAELGLAPQGAIYLCPATLFKIHPDFDRYLEKLLIKDPHGHLYFFEYQQTALHHHLQRRFHKTLTAVQDRIHFLPWQSGLRLLHYLYRADVVLDPPHFGLGTTAFQVLAAHTPIVTHPGEMLASRQTYSRYVLMDYFECVAQDADHYAELACRLGNDALYNHTVRQELARRVDILFDNPAGSRELAQIISSWFKS